MYARTSFSFFYVFLMMKRKQSKHVVHEFLGHRKKTETLQIAME